jgi:hypothetical protein
MADEKPKPRSKRTKRLRAPSRDEYVRYIVAIERWDWSYSLSLDGRKDSLDPYMEHRHVRIDGKLLHPKLPSAETVEVHLIPRGDLDQDRRKDDQPSAVGSLRVHDGRLVVLQPIPKDSLTAVLQVLIADRFRFVDMGGARLRHRQALLNSFSLATHIDPDDMPAAAGTT